MQSGLRISIIERDLTLVLQRGHSNHEHLSLFGFSFAELSNTAFNSNALGYQLQNENVFTSILSKAAC